MGVEAQRGNRTSTCKTLMMNKVRSGSLVYPL
jgi:hypothetical protein